MTKKKDQNVKQELNKIIDALRQKDIVITSIVPNKSTLEDYFISVINDSENGERKL